ncbi:hypothetical protein DFH06DRAFT_1402738 [Mycena polygramma]|nr:hypothetical protein DFH06DRAFT_1402738 [Mycena polygramma]
MCLLPAVSIALLALPSRGLPATRSLPSHSIVVIGVAFHPTRPSDQINLLRSPSSFFLRGAFLLAFFLRACDLRLCEIRDYEKRERDLRFAICVCVCDCDCDCDLRETRTASFWEDTSICSTGSAVLAPLLLVFQEPPTAILPDAPIFYAFWFFIPYLITITIPASAIYTPDTMSAPIFPAEKMDPLLALLIPDAARKEGGARLQECLRKVFDLAARIGHQQWATETARAREEGFDAGRKEGLREASASLSCADSISVATQTDTCSDTPIPSPCPVTQTEPLSFPMSDHSSPPPSLPLPDSRIVLDDEKTDPEPEIWHEALELPPDDEPSPPSPSTFTRDFSDLRTGVALPFASLQRRRRRATRNPASTPLSPRRSHTPRTIVLKIYDTKPKATRVKYPILPIPTFRPPPPASACDRAPCLDWDRDPRLCDLSRALTALGWAFDVERAVALDASAAALDASAASLLTQEVWTWMPPGKNHAWDPALDRPFAPLVGQLRSAGVLPQALQSNGVPSQAPKNSKRFSVLLAESWASIASLQSTGLAPPPAGQVGFAGDRPQDRRPRPRAGPDFVPEADDISRDFGPIYFDHQISDATKERRHARKRENQSMRWLQTVIPLLVPVYLEVVAAMDNLRTLDTIYDQESVCFLAALGCLRNHDHSNLPVLPSLAIDLRVLEFVMRLFLNMPPNNTALTRTLEGFLDSMGYKLDNWDALRRRFGTALEWYTSMRHLTTARISRIIDAARNLLPENCASQEGSVASDAPASTSRPSTPRPSTLRSSTPSTPLRSSPLKRKLPSSSATSPPDSSPPSSPSKRARTGAPSSSPSPSPPPTPKADYPFPEPEERSRPSDYLRARCPACFGGKWEDPAMILAIILSGDACFTQRRNKSKGHQDPPVRHPATVFVAEDVTKSMETFIESVRPSQPAPRKKSTVVDDDEEDHLEDPHMPEPPIGAGRLRGLVLRRRR